jgi:hypothetical protein
MADLKVALSANGDNPVAGDLYLENGTARLTHSLAESVAQDLLISLSLFKGEWFLDPSQGMPYFQSILGNRTPLTIVGQIFKQAILSRPGVKQITSFNLKRIASRSIELIFAATLTDGTTITSSSYGPFIVGA